MTGNHKRKWWNNNGKPTLGRWSGPGGSIDLDDSSKKGNSYQNGKHGSKGGQNNFWKQSNGGKPGAGGWKDSQKSFQKDKMPWVSYNGQQKWAQMTHYSAECGAGIVNTGSNCYINATFQMLAHVPAIVDYMLSKDHPRETCVKMKENAFCTLCSFRRIVGNIRNGSSPVYINGFMKNMSAFAKGMSASVQEDAHEFLQKLIESMLLAGVPPSTFRKLTPGMETDISKKSELGKIIGCLQVNTIRCLRCRLESRTYDWTTELQLALNGASDLTHALKLHTKMERLSGDTAYRCEKCKMLTDASKRYSLLNVPNVLFIQFKRFGNSYNGSKLGHFMPFGESLNIRPYMEDTRSAAVHYKLVGVIVHEGATTFSGHYYSYVKKPPGIWIRKDDEIVTRVPLPAVLNCKAYILAYERVGAAPNFSVSIIKPSSAAGLSSTPAASSSSTSVIGPQLPPQVGSAVSESQKRKALDKGAAALPKKLATEPGMSSYKIPKQKSSASSNTVAPTKHADELGTASPKKSVVQGPSMVPRTITATTGKKPHASNPSSRPIIIKVKSITDLKGRAIHVTKSSSIRIIPGDSDTTSAQLKPNGHEVGTKTPRKKRSRSASSSSSDRNSPAKSACLVPLVPYNSPPQDSSEDDDEAIGMAAGLSPSKRSCAKDGSQVESLRVVISDPPGKLADSGYSTSVSRGTTVSPSDCPDTPPPQHPLSNGDMKSSSGADKCRNLDKVNTAIDITAAFSGSSSPSKCNAGISANDAVSTGKPRSASGVPVRPPLGFVRTHSRSKVVSHDSTATDTESVASSVSSFSPPPKPHAGTYIRVPTKSEMGAAEKIIFSDSEVMKVSGATLKLRQRSRSCDVSVKKPESKVWTWNGWGWSLERRHETTEPAKPKESSPHRCSSCERITVKPGSVHILPTKEPASSSLSIRPTTASKAPLADGPASHVGLKEPTVLPAKVMAHSKSATELSQSKPSVASHRKSDRKKKSHSPDVSAPDVSSRLTASSKSELQEYGPALPESMANLSQEGSTKDTVKTENRKNTFVRPTLSPQKRKAVAAADGRKRAAANSGESDSSGTASVDFLGQSSKEDPRLNQDGHLSKGDRQRERKRMQNQRQRDRKRGFKREKCVDDASQTGKSENPLKSEKDRSSSSLSSNVANERDRQKVDSSQGDGYRTGKRSYGRDRSGYSRNRDNRDRGDYRREDDRQSRDSVRSRSHYDENSRHSELSQGSFHSRRGDSNSRDSFRRHNSNSRESFRSDRNRDKNSSSGRRTSPSKDYRRQQSSSHSQEQESRSKRFENVRGSLSPQRKKEQGEGATRWFSDIGRESVKTGSPAHGSTRSPSRRQSSPSPTRKDESTFASLEASRQTTSDKQTSEVKTPQSKALKRSRSRRRNSLSNTPNKSRKKGDPGKGCTKITQYFSLK